MASEWLYVSYPGSACEIDQNMYLCSRPLPLSLFPRLIDLYYTRLGDPIEFCRSQYAKVGEKRVLELSGCSYQSAWSARGMHRGEGCIEEKIVSGIWYNIETKLQWSTALAGTGCGGMSEDWLLLCEWRLVIKIEIRKGSQMPVRKQAIAHTRRWTEVLA